jgi:hypothetical protein
MLAALSLMACTEKTETAEAPPGPPPPTDPAVAEPIAGPQAVEGQIDWAAARDAKSKQQITDSPVSVQQVDANAGPPKVPVLLPSGVVQAQNARPPALVQTKDGYFATYHLPQYDAIVNGSQKSYQAGAAAAGGDKSAMKFSTGEGSAQLAFSRFGADYLIEFECREVDGANSCITEDQAKEFAESLFVQQTQ